jgi:hypothetical protein
MSTKRIPLSPTRRNAVQAALGKSHFRAGKVREIPPGEPFVMIWSQLAERLARLDLSAAAHKALWRLVVEHCRHAGLENGALIVTHRQFEEIGIRHGGVKPALDELAAAGLIGVTRSGRGRNGDGVPNRYRITFLKAKFVPITGEPYYLPPTHEWLDRPESAAKKPRAEERKCSPENHFTGERICSPARSESAPQRDGAPPDSAIPLGSKNAPPIYISGSIASGASPPRLGDGASAPAAAGRRLREGRR